MYMLKAMPSPPLDLPTCDKRPDKAPGFFPRNKSRTTCIRLISPHPTPTPVPIQFPIHPERRRSKPAANTRIRIGRRLRAGAFLTLAPSPSSPSRRQEMIHMSLVLFIRYPPVHLARSIIPVAAIFAAMARQAGVSPSTWIFLLFTSCKSLEQRQ